jgi:hypothetical protein
LSVATGASLHPATKPCNSPVKQMNCVIVQYD